MLPQEEKAAANGRSTPLACATPNETLRSEALSSVLGLAHPADRQPPLVQLVRGVQRVRRALLALPKPRIARGRLSRRGRTPHRHRPVRPAKKQDDTGSGCPGSLTWDDASQPSSRPAPRSGFSSPPPSIPAPARKWSPGPSLARPGMAPSCASRPAPSTPILYRAKRNLTSAKSPPAKPERRGHGAVALWCGERPAAGPPTTVSLLAANPALATARPHGRPSTDH